MTATVILNQAAFVTLNGAGNGTASLGPLTAREVWHPQNISVRVNTNVKEATCAVYIGDTATQGNFRDATFSGSSGDTTDAANSDTIKCGWKIFAVWTGGDANQVATVVVTGTKEV